MEKSSDARSFLQVPFEGAVAQGFEPSASAFPGKQVGRRMGRWEVEQQERELTPTSVFEHGMQGPHLY